MTLSIFRVKLSISNKIVILRACDFIDLSCETLDLPKTRHPERSASQTYRVPPHSVGAESKDPGGAHLAYCRLELFNR